MKNREKLTQMSNEELAEWIAEKTSTSNCDCCAFRNDDEKCHERGACVAGTLLWLESEAEDEEG